MAAEVPDARRRKLAAIPAADVADSSWPTAKEEGAAPPRRSIP